MMVEFVKIRHKMSVSEGGYALNLSTNNKGGINKWDKTKGIKGCC